MRWFASNADFCAALSCRSSRRYDSSIASWLASIFACGFTVWAPAGGASSRHNKAAIKFRFIAAPCFGTARRINVQGAGTRAQARPYSFAALS